MIGKIVGNEFRNDNDVIIESFYDIPIHELTELPMITVYDHPCDYPGKYVARLSGIVSGQPLQFKYIVLKNSIDEIRNCIPSYMVFLGRFFKDDPKILECYI